MEKKNPYKFTLGFDKTKPSHVRATEILNSVKDKADLIASALVSYIDDVRQEETKYAIYAVHIVILEGRQTKRCQNR